MYALAASNTYPPPLIQEALRIPWVAVPPGHLSEMYSHDLRIHIPDKIVVHGRKDHSSRFPTAGYRS